MPAAEAYRNTEKLIYHETRVYAMASIGGRRMALARTRTTPLPLIRNEFLLTESLLAALRFRSGVMKVNAKLTTERLHRCGRPLQYLSP